MRNDRQLRLRKAPADVAELAMKSSDWSVACCISGREEANEIEVAVPERFGHHTCLSDDVCDLFLPVRLRPDAVHEQNVVLGVDHLWRDAGCRRRVSRRFGNQWLDRRSRLKAVGDCFE